MNIKSIEDLRISDCCSILHIKQDNVLVELIDFQASDKEQQAVLNQLKILLKKQYYHIELVWPLKELEKLLEILIYLSLSNLLVV